MKVTGIVAEFNPLHNGHVYIMEESRRITSCDALVVAMSGNFVQRGEPAIMDKWKRAEAALSCGADLIFEIPTLFSLGNAGSFANAGVRILEAAGCDAICCGSESGKSPEISELAGFIKANKDRIEASISDLTGEGKSYPAAREKAVLDLLDNEEQRLIVSEILHNSNDILALEYMMAVESAEILCIERKGATYNDDFDEGRGFQSASGIRDLIRKETVSSSIEKISPYLPKASLDMLLKYRPVFLEDCSDMLRYAALSKEAAEIDECPSGGEGLGNLIRKAALSNETARDIIRACKSKRYTYTRISRLCIEIILGITRGCPPERSHSTFDPAYLRVLGFNKKGREVLSELKKMENAGLPIITNINKEAGHIGKAASKMLAIDVKASDIYSLIAHRSIDEHSDHRIKPMMTE